MNAQVLASRLEALFINGTWIANTNYTKVLEDVTWQESEQKIGDHNSIASLTFHINYYLKGVTEVFQDKPLTIRDKYSFDCPKIDSDLAWQKRKSDLSANAKTCIAIVKTFTDKQLQNVFVKKEYGDYLRSIDGILEHSYYHLGQISLIKTLIRA